MKSVMQRVDGRTRITPALHAGDVQAITLRVIADSQSKRQRVFDDDRVAADVSLFADAAKLMNAGVSADVRAVFDNDVPRERRGVGHDDAVADETVVRDVRLGHDQAVVADAREHAAAGGAAMNGDKLANLVAGADARFGWLTFVLEILRREADRDEGKNVCLSADGSATVDHAV